MRCTSCRRVLELAHVWVGSKTICPYCHAVMHVPDVVVPKRREWASAEAVAGAILRLLIVLVLLAVCGFVVWTWIF